MRRAHPAAEAEGLAEDLYERYKNALRAGHVAVLRGRLADALVSYREAAAIAPDRALPHTSLGGVLLRLGHVDEALFEYDAARVRAPHDEAVLLGRAEALVVAGRPAEAAASLDGVADIQEASGRLPEAADTIERALELESTPQRHERRTSMAARLQPSGAEPADEGLGRSLRRMEPGEAAVAPEGQETSEDDTTGRGEARQDEEAGGGASAPDSSGAAPVDLGALERRAEAAMDAQDAGEATIALIALTKGRGDSGLLDAALDAAHLALAIRPDDPQIHLALVDLYLVHGWRDLAVEKLAMLDRLAAMSDDQATRDRVAHIAAARLGGDRRLAGIGG